MGLQETRQAWRSHMERLVAAPGYARVANVSIRGGCPSRFLPACRRISTVIGVESAAALVSSISLSVS